LDLKGSLLWNGSDEIPRVPSIFVGRNGILVVFSSAEGSEWNSENSFNFCSTVQILSCFLFPGRVICADPRDVEIHVNIFAI
jgi:hypothetical protein